ncbi:MAG TPA: dockerin type I repeat-containing protein, partial [bacterium]|nr:dockerin type I repeat-containing protein [bacterium]
PLGSFPVYPTGTWEWDGADWREFSSSLQGDINGDGELDIRDVVICLRIVLGWNDFDSRADLNGDGQVNIQDVILLLRVVLA